MAADLDASAVLDLPPVLLTDLVFHGDLEFFNRRNAQDAGVESAAVLNNDPQSVSTELTVDLVLQVTDSAGVPIHVATVGSEFVLHVYAQDLREQPYGVFAAWLDVSWGESLATMSGDIEFPGPYQTVRSGTASPGFIDEAGAAGGQTQLFGGLHEVFRVPFVATAVGNLIFTADPAEETPLHDILVHSKNIAMPLDVVRFGTAELTIAGAPADTGTPDDGAAAAATEFAALMFLTSPASVRVEAAVFSVDPELSILPTPSQPLAADIAPLLSAPQPADSGSEVDRVGEASAESFDIPETLDFAALGNTDPLWPDNPGDGF